MANEELDLTCAADFIGRAPARPLVMEHAAHSSRGRESHTARRRPRLTKALHAHLERKLHSRPGRPGADLPGRRDLEREGSGMEAPFHRWAARGLTWREGGTWSGRGAWQVSGMEAPFHRWAARGLMWREAVVWEAEAGAWTALMFRAVRTRRGTSPATAWPRGFCGRTHPRPDSVAATGGARGDRASNS